MERYEHIEQYEQVAELKTWLGTGSINIFGVPFAGKDTQGAILRKLFDATLLSSGDILRNSAISEEAKKITEKGGLTPTEEFQQTVLPYLSREEFTGRPMILSSVGRWKGEEEMVIKAASAADHPLRAVVCLMLPEARVYERYFASQHTNDRGGRADDSSIDILRARLDEFTNKTLPVMDFYRGKGLLVEVDGDQSPNEVTAMILSELIMFSGRA